MSTQEIKESLDTVLALQLAHTSQDVSILNAKNTPDPIDSEIEFTMPFANNALINSVYVKPADDNKQYSVYIYDSDQVDKVTEYRKKNITGVNYDVMPLPYIDSLNQSKIYVKIINHASEPLELDFIRIRGFKT